MNLSRPLSFFFRVGEQESRNPTAQAGPEPIAVPPRPAGPWVLAQTWHDLLFMHWPVAPEVLRPHLPAGLTLDTFDGQAWIAVLPFWMSGIRARGCPPIPFTSSFAEINVRTYVVRDGIPGIYFFSLDADSAVAVGGASTLFHLPYFLADIEMESDRGRFTYRSRRSTGTPARPWPSRTTATSSTPPSCATCSRGASWRVGAAS